MYSFLDLGAAQGRLAGSAAPVLGIEVTDPALAAACALGNIDPQHGPDAGRDSGCAALAALDHPLPPAGAILATVRPDLDSVGAMALLALRQRGVAVTPGMANRLRRIDRADGFRHGPWPGPRPLPASPADLLEDSGGADLAAAAATAMDRSLELAERVEHVADWIRTGAPPRCHADAAEARARRLVTSLVRGATRVRATGSPEVATVVSLEAGALRLGYRLAPIVVALNPAFRFPDASEGRKFTIATYAPGHADLNAAAAILGAREPGWGGQAGIKGSPTGRGSQLALDEVVSVVCNSLEGS